MIKIKVVSEQVVNGKTVATLQGVDGRRHVAVFTGQYDQLTGARIFQGRFNGFPAVYYAL